MQKKEHAAWTMDMTEQHLRQGQPLGHYRLIRLLGQGGFAEVYLGEHIHLNTPVAVKVLQTRLTEEDVLAFKREAQTVARLLHPHIVRVLDFGVQDTIPYLVMDYAPNGTLRHAFPKGCQLLLPTVVSLTRQMAEALQYAHDQRLIHRDIKPENMLLGRNREVLLSDFGIALVQQSSRLQSTQNIAGTIAYMAPEQIQAHPCFASDQYSLGIVVYEWLCGTRPFQGSYTEIAIKQSMVPPPPLRTHIPGIPSSVEQVVMQALQKDPQQRFANMRSFVLALEQAAQQPEARSFPLSTNSSAVSSTARGLFSPPSPSLPASNLVVPPPSTSVSTLSTPAFQSPAVPAGSFALSTPPLASALQAGSGPPFQQPQQPSAYPSITPPLPGQPGFPAAFPQREQKRGLSRRAFFLGGTLGLLAGAGIVAELILRQQSSNPLQHALNTLQQAGNIPNASQPTAELTYSHHTALVWIVRWSPDGKFIASGSFDGTMLVWTADTGETQLSVRSTAQPAESDDYPWSIAWSSRQDQKVAVSFVDGTAQVLNASSGQRLPSFTASASSVTKLTWSPDEQYIAIGGSDNIVRVYAYPSWKIVTTYQEHTDVITTLAWSPDGQTLASGSEDTTVRLWEPLTGQTKLIYKGHTNRIGSLSWSSDSMRVVSTSSDQTARVWQTDVGTTLYTYNAPGGAPIGEASWSHNDRTIAIYGGDAKVYLLDAQSGQVKSSIFTGVIYSLSWSPDDTRIVTGSYNKVAQIWRV